MVYWWSGRFMLAPDIASEMTENETREKITLKHTVMKLASIALQRNMKWSDLKLNA